jgi:hypothetical protein
MDFESRGIFARPVPLAGPRIQSSGNITCEGPTVPPSPRSRNILTIRQANAAGLLQVKPLQSPDETFSAESSVRDSGTPNRAFSHRGDPTRSAHRLHRVLYLAGLITWRRSDQRVARSCEAVLNYPIQIAGLSCI